ncbi:MAG: (d)CMP kinase [Acidimicrobiaceae bacterium]|nr:(d)CMP kinase [Acidimicrobiaceae bacterium]
MSGAVIAIDGPAGSGKSTVARAVANALGWTFLDTGAMYRAVTVEALARGIELSDEEAVARLADSLVITNSPRVCVDGRDVQDDLRTERVNLAVSTVAANPAVRRVMVERQREFAQNQAVGTVVEGRDITTVVFPHATLKVYLTASLEQRAMRRGEEGAHSLSRRDVADTTREASPLRRAPDAHVIDTTSRPVDEVVQEIIECLKNLNSI